MLNKKVKNRRENNCNLICLIVLVSVALRLRRDINLILFQYVMDG